MTRDMILDRINNAVSDIENELGKYITIKCKLDGEYVRSSFNNSSAGIDQAQYWAERWVDEGAIQMTINATDDRWY